ncbi:hypothetical protein EDM27_17425, partial [Staphylococcus aureus]
AMGLPAQGLALIIGVDRLLDMVRTCANVIGNALSAMGLPAQGLALIIGVDRLLDMVRTCANVIGNAL